MNKYQRLDCVNCLIQTANLVGGYVMGFTGSRTMTAFIGIGFSVWSFINKPIKDQL